MRAQADPDNDNVVPLERPDSEPEPELTERQLVERLLELLTARESMDEKRAEAMRQVDEIDGQMQASDREIVSIKRTLGASVRGKRGKKGSRPTPAATSQSGSSQDLRPQMMAAMKTREWWKPVEVLDAMGIEDSAVKQRVRGLLAREARNKKLRRRRAGKTTFGNPAYVYGLRKSTK
jgi:hypothetical protein